MSRTTSKRLSVAVLCLAFLASLGFGAEPEPPVTIEIDVSPKTLNIQSEGDIVTVHTDIPYSQVAGATVALNGVAISWWKSDNQGNFVAKFVMGEVKELYEDGSLSDGTNTLMLIGQTKSYVDFVGWADITVINVEPRGRR